MAHFAPIGDRFKSVKMSRLGTDLRALPKWKRLRRVVVIIIRMRPFTAIAAGQRQIQACQLNGIPESLVNWQQALPMSWVDSGYATGIVGTDGNLDNAIIDQLFCMAADLRVGFFHLPTDKRKRSASFIQNRGKSEQAAQQRAALVNTATSLWQIKVEKNAACFGIFFCAGDSVQPIFGAPLKATDNRLR